MEKNSKLPLKQVFLNGNFFSLWLGQIVSQFGERLTQMALIGLIYEKNLVSTNEMSKLLIAMILPVFLFGPIAGVYVDIWDRKKTLIFTDLIRASLVLILPFIYTILNNNKNTSLLSIYIIVFLIFAVTRFFIPAKSAIIPEIMDPDFLRAANSIASTTKMIGTILGVLLGGIIVTYLGVKTCFYIDGGTFIVSAICISFIKRKNISKKSIPDIEINTAISKVKLITTQFFEGLKEIKTNKHIYFLVKILSILMAAGGSIFVIFPVFVNKQFHTHTNGLSIMISMLSAGLFLGALLMGKYLNNKTNKNMICKSIIFIAVLFILLANLKNIFLACIVMFTIGFVGIPIIICAETLIHEMVEDKMIGRVYSSVEIIIHAAFLIAMGLTGLLGDIASPGFIFSILGIIFAILIFLVITHEKINTYKSEHDVW